MLSLSTIETLRTRGQQKAVNGKRITLTIGIATGKVILEAPEAKIHTTTR